MKVCMILKSDFQSFKHDSRVLREATALTGAGHNVCVLLYGKKGMCLDYKGISVYVTELETERLINKYRRFMQKAGAIGKLFSGLIIHLAARFFNTEYYLKTLQMAEKLNPDIYHCHDIATLAIGIRLKNLTNKKVVYDSHELWSGSSEFTGLRGALRGWIVVLKERRLMRKTDVNITVNASIARYLEQKYSLDKVYVIRNVPEKPAALNNKSLLRQELGINKDCKIVLYLGALMEGRGLENLLKAWDYVDSGIVLVIMGFGPLYRVLEDAVSASGLSGKLFIKKGVDPDKVLGYTISSDLGVVTSQNTCLSYYYSSPNKVWEYILAGVPFLASDFPELGKLARDEGMGMVIDPDSPLDIAEKVNFILSEKNRHVYDRMKENCVYNGMWKYNWNIEKTKLIDIYGMLNE
ncbi:MAG: glycosyltransferase [Acetivibrionales bacterium]|jgi:glycosyltransferase involved in cell wall biosynthesis